MPRSIPVIFFLALCVSHSLLAQNDPFKIVDQDKLPYGNSYEKWEKTTPYTHTWHVAQNHPAASDNNPGTLEAPWKTISKAARELQPGHKVIIHQGTYFETIVPARGGESPERMITYQAAENEKVIVTGAFQVDPSELELSQGWQTGDVMVSHYDDVIPEKGKVWQYNLRNVDFQGYNPFGMLNLMQDQEWLDYKKVNMKAHFQKRGWVLIDGKRLEQVTRPVDLSNKPDGAWFSEHNGLRIHIRFPSGKDPTNSRLQLVVKEQLFSPETYGLAYIKIKGIHFLYAANGFPVPQRGIISAARGHHWIIEDCIIEGANSLGVDLGNEMWHTQTQPITGFHIFRRNVVKNCGIAGLQGMRATSYLVEDNLFENIGWHNAEHGWESGAIKFHLSTNTLIRRNVFRNIIYAPGIWLDYLASQNCRITGNVFTGITSARGAVYIEVSRGLIDIDHNVMHKTRSQYWISGDYGAGGSALYTDGSDSIRFYNNLAFDIENTGFGAYANAARIVAGRGGTDRNHSVTHNIFAGCGKHGIEFPNIHNFANHNVYSSMPAGYLKIKNPAPELLLDLKAWQDYYGWEKNGQLVSDPGFKLDEETLTLTFDSTLLNGTDAGPFQKGKDFRNGIEIDPRYNAE